MVASKVTEARVDYTLPRQRISSFAFRRRSFRYTLVQAHTSSTWTIAVGAVEPAEADKVVYAKALCAVETRKVGT